jgi:hypothetical protein
LSFNEDGQATVSISRESDYIDVEVGSNRELSFSVDSINKLRSFLPIQWKMSETLSIDFRRSPIHAGFDVDAVGPIEGSPFLNQGNVMRRRECSLSDLRGAGC